MNLHYATFTHNSEPTDGSTSDLDRLGVIYAGIRHLPAWHDLRLITDLYQYDEEIIYVNSMLLLLFILYISSVNTLHYFLILYE